MSVKLTELREPLLDAKDPRLDANDPRLLPDDIVSVLADKLEDKNVFVKVCTKAKHNGLVQTALGTQAPLFLASHTSLS